RALDQRGADAAALVLARDRDGPEQEGQDAVADCDVPQARGADHAAVFGRDEGQSFGGKALFAQALGGFAIARLAKGLVENGFARVDLGDAFVPDRGHDSSFPISRARSCVARDAKQFQWWGRGGGVPPPVVVRCGTSSTAGSR